jgi:Transposase DDE domain
MWHKDQRSAIDGRTTRHAGYGMSQRKLKLVEEAFGWGKTIAGIAKVKVRGLRLVRHAFTIAMAAYNLIRIPRLLAAA